jgi:DNA replication licensing factor MCM3
LEITTELLTINLRKKFVNLMFMRKYVHLAKGLKPQLTKEAADLISEEYTKLRNQENLESDNMARTQPVTARCLETLIRLSTAHAKARLSNKVEARDAEVAIEILLYACYKKVDVKGKKNRKKEAFSDEEEEEEVDEERPSSAPVQRKTPPTKRPHGGSEDDEEEEEEEEEEAETQAEEADRQPRKRTRRKTQLEGQSQASAKSLPILTAEK